MNAVIDHASFRDPSGHVYHVDGQVFRTVSGRAALHYEYVRDRGLLRRWSDEGWIVATREVDSGVLENLGSQVRYVLEHPRLPFISYPYEWPFPALKAAALLHLDLQIEALDEGVSLSDASAYNIQFVGCKPMFIDVVSFRVYQDGEFWTGHRQFCEQFLNPLLLRALLGVPHNAWYRGNLEGIPGLELKRLLTLRHKCSWKVFTHVVLPARLQEKFISGSARDKFVRLGGKKLPRPAYRFMLTQLRKWVSHLEPRDTGPTTWSEYEAMHTYDPEEYELKRKFIAEFASHVKPRLVWDLGCNTGEYAEVALNSGAEIVIGFDFDQGALEKAFGRARLKALSLLPLFLDAANPSPNQGWNGCERQGLEARAPADGLLALAFVHHLVIGRNVPLDQVVRWIVGLARHGVIEFVPKADPTVHKMLTLRDDIFEDYSEECFTQVLMRRARIVRSEVVSKVGRRLFHYER